MPIVRFIRIFGCIVLSFTFLSFTSCAKKTTPVKTVYTAPPHTHSTTSSTPRLEKVSATPISTANMENSILYYVNAHRESVGLTPLQLSNIESNVAAQHCKNMAAGRTPFGHRGLQLRMNAIDRQIGPITATGENVAYGQMTAKEVVEGWLQSPGHKRNIEGNFKLTGIGWAKDTKGMIYYTQIFTR
jgi:uncharacterized protein YkwD